MADVKFGAILQHPGIPEMTVMFLHRGVWVGKYEAFAAVLLTNRAYPANYSEARWTIGSVVNLWTVESWTLLHA